MTTTTLQPSRSFNSRLVHAGKLTLRMLGILLVAYLAFFCYVAAHEMGGARIGR